MLVLSLCAQMVGLAGSAVETVSYYTIQGGGQLHTQPHHAALSAGE